MPWLRIDTGFARHRKVGQLTDREFRVHVSAMCWVAEYATDGHIPAACFPDIRGLTRKIADRLVVAGVWEHAGDGYRIHDWLDYNITAEEAARQQETKRERQRQWAAKKRAAREARTTQIDPRVDASTDTSNDAPTDVSVDATTRRRARGRRPDPTRPDPSSKEEGRGGTATPPAPQSGAASPNGANGHHHQPAGLIPAHQALAALAATSPTIAAALHRRDTTTDG